MPKKTGPKGKRNPQDTTLRNVRAAKKRDEKIAKWQSHMEEVIGELEWKVDALQDQIDLLKE